MNRVKVFTLTGTTPAAAGNAVVAKVNGLARINGLRIDAQLIGATGGVLDLYLQRNIVPNTPGAVPIWLDWLHFAQLAAGAAAIVKSVADVSGSSGLVTVGQMSDDLATGAFALAANTFVGGLPGDEVRLCAVAGASTSAGALITVTLTTFELFT